MDLRCESRAAQKKREPKPRVLYLLNRWLFQLFSSVVDVRDAFVDVQYFVTLHRLLGTPDILELRSLERRGTARLAFIIIGLVGLVGDIDAGHICYCNHSCLLTLSAKPSPSLGIPIKSQRLLKIPSVRN